MTALVTSTVLTLLVSGVVGTAAQRWRLPGGAIVWAIAAAAALHLVRTDLPPGLIGNPDVLGVPQQCRAAELTAGECPNGSQIGLARISLYKLEFDLVEPVYMMAPPGGDVIASGIIRERQELVERAFEAQGLAVLRIEHQGEWVVIEARKPDTFVIEREA